MPKRTDIKTVAIIGAGPIVIGQACEFDYSGTQACKVLRSLGYKIVLINSNPATIMTDPAFADRTYIEPLTIEYVTEILKRERPDAILPTLGGQTALNLTMELHKSGVLAELGIELLGADAKAIEVAENREAFKNAMIDIGVPVPQSHVIHSLEEARSVRSQLEFPVIIRAAFTLGGAGGSIAYNIEEYEELVQWGLMHSPVSEVLVEESVLGWKEIELEVMRDGADQVVIVCGIENLDPMGTHTGDSITVAPIQTLADKEYQQLREYSKAIMRRVGVKTGGSNVQFAVNPSNGRVVVIEMNPRVSRSSALASKATGFPIAKIAAMLAVGFRLDEIKNDITGKTYACFEPSLDYVVVKIPRFGFEKFPQTKDLLGPQMRSVGEVMAIGRTFPEALQKALRGLETKNTGLNEVLRTRPESCIGGSDTQREVLLRIRQELQLPSSRRLFWVAEAFRFGMGVDQCFELSGIDRWFLRHLREIVLAEDDVKQSRRWLEDSAGFRKLKQMGFSDARLAQLSGLDEQNVRERRHELGLRPAYLCVDTCAGEFPSVTPYYYSTYQQHVSDSRLSDSSRAIAIIGSGPNRIGQGLEFDYCCVHASFALRQKNIRSVMINCNPETVSTDYDTSSVLYFESLTEEDVTEVLDYEGVKEVIVYFGGQTPLMLSEKLEKDGYQLLGSTHDQIDLTEDRQRFSAFIKKLNLKQPPSITAASLESALEQAKSLGMPILARPSYVIGGRGMRVIHREKDLEPALTELMKGVEISQKTPVLLDSFLSSAIEVDVDALRDRTGDVWIPGIMEHIEEAGVHSGDSTCSFPPYTLSEETQNEIRRVCEKIIRELQVVGLINIQLAIQNRDVFVLEVNPRASRTVPFLSKAIGLSLAHVATRLLLGETLLSLGIKTQEKRSVHIAGKAGFAVKMPVFPFLKFPGVDPILGPEMKSTGEVMSIGQTFGEAFLKVMDAVYSRVPEGAGIFVSVKDEDKPLMKDAVIKLQQMGYSILSTSGTADYFESQQIQGIRRVKKVLEGRPHVLDALKNQEIHLVFNTTLGKKAVSDAQSIRRAALMGKIPYFTTVSGAYAAVEALMTPRKSTGIHCLQGELGS